METATHADRSTTAPSSHNHQPPINHWLTTPPFFFLSFLVFLTKVALPEEELGRVPEVPHLLRQRVPDRLLEVCLYYMYEEGRGGLRFKRRRRGDDDEMSRSGSTLGEFHHLPPPPKNGPTYLGVVDEPDEGLALLDRLPEDGHLHARAPQVGGAVHVLVFVVPWGAGGVWRRSRSQSRGELAHTARHTHTIQS